MRSKSAAPWAAILLASALGLACGAEPDTDEDGTREQDSMFPRDQTTIPVNPLQALVDQASPGQTITVRPGQEYLGELTIDKPITLQGVSTASGRPRIVGNVKLVANKVGSGRAVLRGFTIVAPSYTKKLVRVARGDVTIENNELMGSSTAEDCSYGVLAQAPGDTGQVYLEGGSSSAGATAPSGGPRLDNLVITGNTITNCSKGISVSDSVQTTNRFHAVSILGNRITNASGNGIVVYGSDGSDRDTENPIVTTLSHHLIKGNTISQGRKGIELYNSHGNAVLDNTLREIEFAYVLSPSCYDNLEYSPSATKVTTGGSICDIHPVGPVCVNKTGTTILSQRNDCSPSQQ